MCGLCQQKTSRLACDPVWACETPLHQRTPVAVLIAEKNGEVIEIESSRMFTTLGASYLSSLVYAEGKSEEIIDEINHRINYDLLTPSLVMERDFEALGFSPDVIYRELFALAENGYEIRLLLPYLSLEYTENFDTITEPESSAGMQM